MMNESQKKIKKSRLRAIDNGTRYDVAGKLIRMGRRIRADNYGDVRDVVVSVCSVCETGGELITCYHFGTGDIATAHFMLDAAKGKITG